MHQQYNLSHRDALRVVEAIRAELEQQGKGAAIAVADAHGELLAFLRTDGCKLPSIQIAINKAFTAAREQKPSRAIGESARDDRWPMTNFGDLRYTAWGGGVPLLHAGQVVGGVQELV
ncbi:MAG TPA: heme-binding protein, partial [Caldilinea sp.]|nr:heme-binding protein [Caldilinea sp.]